MGSTMIKNVSKRYSSGKDNPFVLDDLSLEIREGEFVCVLGKSGCGKSTLLNLIAGYIQPDFGEIYSDGELVTGPSQNRGVVFQEHALFPWYTVYQNIAFGPRINKNPKKDEIADRYLKMIGLEEYRNYYPRELSGGMKQRVGIARAFANDPKILLMDEPFSALDPTTRQAMREELLTLWQESRKTVIFITHDIAEAVYLADRVVVLNHGKVSMDECIDIPRPRDIHSDVFLSLSDRFETEIHQE